MNLNRLTGLIDEKTKEEIKNIELTHKEKLKNLKAKYKKIFQNKKDFLEQKTKNIISGYYEQEKHKLKQRVKLQLDNFIIKFLTELEKDVLNYFQSLPEQEKFKWYKEKLELVIKKYGNKLYGLEIPKDELKIFEKLAPVILGNYSKKIQIIESEKIKFGFRVLYDHLEIDLNFKSLCHTILTQKITDLKKILL